MEGIDYLALGGSMHIACTLKLFKVPSQGSPKAPLLELLLIIRSSKNMNQICC